MLEIFERNVLTIRINWSYSSNNLAWLFHLLPLCLWLSYPTPITWKMSFTPGRKLSMCSWFVSSTCHSLLLYLLTPPSHKVPMIIATSWHFVSVLTMRLSLGTSLRQIGLERLSYLMKAVVLLSLCILSLE